MARITTNAKNAVGDFLRATFSPEMSVLTTHKDQLEAMYTLRIYLEQHIWD